MRREYLEQDVYEALQERLKFLFEEFENIYLSFSGGKDSGLLLNLVLEFQKKYYPDAGRFWPPSPRFRLLPVIFLLPRPFPGRTTASGFIPMASTAAAARSLRFSTPIRRLIRPIITHWKRWP